MKFATGFLLGAIIASSALIMTSPANMRKVRRRCKCAKKMLRNLI